MSYKSTPVHVGFKYLRKNTFLKKTSFAPMMHAKVGEEKFLKSNDRL